MEAIILTMAMKHYEERLRDMMAKMESVDDDELKHLIRAVWFDNYIDPIFYTLEAVIYRDC